MLSNNPFGDGKPVRFTKPLEHISDDGQQGVEEPPVFLWFSHNNHLLTRDVVVCLAHLQVILCQQPVVP